MSLNDEAYARYRPTAEGHDLRRMVPGFYDKHYSEDDDGEPISYQLQRVVLDQLMPHSSVGLTHLSAYVHDPARQRQPSRSRHARPGGGTVTEMMVVLAELPTLSVDIVFHVGSFDPADKGRSFSSSYEGAGLSVSEHPEAWIEIARLGGLPTWRLQRPGACFLDAHGLDEARRQQVVEWGVAAGLVRPVMRWRASWYDDEYDQRFSADFATKTEALEEVDGDQDAVCEVAALAATATLRARHGTHEDADAFDHLLVEVSRAAGLDGVWWDEDLDPVRLSAPRGTIHPECLAGWRHTLITRPQLPDDLAPHPDAPLPAVVLPPASPER